MPSSGDELEVTNFGFSIPAGVQVNGITFHIRERDSGNGGTFTSRTDDDNVDWGWPEEESREDSE